MPSKPKPTFGPKKPPPLDPAAVENYVSEGAQASRQPDRQASKRSGVRAPTRGRGIIERKGGRVRRRMTVYLSPELARDLGMHAVGQGADVSDLIEEAVSAYLTRPAVRSS